VVEQRAADLEDLVADHRVDQALDHCDQGEGAEFREDVKDRALAGVSLAAEHRAVAEDLGGRIRQAEEHRHGGRQEQVGGNVEGG
jgi:stress-induced morphogen